MSETTRPVSLLADNPLLKQMTADQLERIEKGAWYHSIELPDGTEVPGIIPVASLRDRLTLLGVPDDLRGRRALDIGAATGWNSFELERRGAAVVAIDYVGYEDFQVAKRLLNSAVDYRIMEVDEITVEELGTFDVVLFLGVLYHLRHPLYSLEKVLSVTSGTAYVESFVCDAALSQAEREANSKYLEFYETTELAGQLDNWFGPSTNCLSALCRSAGFADVQFRYVQDNRAAFVCRRRKETSEIPPIVDTVVPSISSAVNNRHGRPEFFVGKDEYICTYFYLPEASIGGEDITLRVGQYDVPVLTVSSHGSGVWQANARLPIDAAMGVLPVSMSVRHSAFSPPVDIYIGCLASEPVTVWDGLPKRPHLYRATQGLTSSNVFEGARSEYLCCCFHLNAISLSRKDIQVKVGSIFLTVDFVGRGDGWQVNCRLPGDLPVGSVPVTVSVCGGTESNEQVIEVRYVRTS